MFSSSSFMVSCLIFRSLQHFEFIFVYGVRECSNFIDLHATVQLSQHHLLKRLYFFHYIFFPSLLKINCPQVCGFISGSEFWSLDPCLFLCHHTVLITEAPQYCLRSQRVMLASFLFLRIPFIILGLLWVHINFWIIFSISVKNVMDNLIGIVLKLYMALGGMANVTILILPIQQHGISFHFFESSPISLFNVPYSSQHISVSFLQVYC